MKCVELFAGAGGLGMGLSRAGFEHVAVIERNRDACQTIRENRRLGVAPIHDWPEVSETDVRLVDFAAIADGAEAVSGGPPCQPFSMGGKHRAHLDDRDMFPEAVRAVREIKPVAFVFENVRGLTRRTFAPFLDYIRLRLSYPDVVRKGDEEWTDHLQRLTRHEARGSEKGLVYRVHYKVVNAADYGVPQHRHRVFFIGIRSDIPARWEFPNSTHSQEALLESMWGSGEYWDRHEVPKRRRPRAPDRFAQREVPLTKPWRTVRDAIRGLPEPTTKPARDFANHILNPGARSYPGHTGSPLDEPAKALKAGVHGVPGGENMLALPDGGVRYFTVREAARIQTFPDDYVFHGAWSECMRQLGNAVPVLLAETVATRLRQAIAIARA